MNMISTKKTAALILSICAPPSAVSCPPGTVPQQGIGWQGCAPVPGTANTPPSVENPAQTIWLDRWGAIAIDRTDGGVGVGSASGMKNERQAKKSALLACQKKGGNRCTIEITYYNQCAAVVWGKQEFTISSASTKEGAEQRSLEKCIKAGETDCVMYFSDCSLAQRAR